MRDVVFARDGWIPKVVRDDGVLRIELGAGADANHDPRTFTFPIEDAHLAVIEDDLRRHLLLWSAILPLCDAAGTRGLLDEDAAVALLDPILFGAPADLEALFRRIRWDRSRLVAHGADLDLLDRGQVWAAMGAATSSADWPRVQEHDADRRRTERGVTLAPLDAAILKFTGRYLHGATIPQRRPEAVDPALLPGVLRVIATAERACAGLRINRDPRRGGRATDKRDWDRMAAAVDAAVRRTHPELVEDAVATVKFLLCSEAASRARSLPIEDDGGVAERPLIFTDDKDGEVTWLPGGPRLRPRSSGSSSASARLRTTRCSRSRTRSWGKASSSTSTRTRARGSQRSPEADTASSTAWSTGWRDTGRWSEPSSQAATPRWMGTARG